MEAYAGIDLHSSNNFIAIIDDRDKVLYAKKLPNKLKAILSALERFREYIKGVVVESTYNWYWLVDGLQEHGYRVHLAGNDNRKLTMCDNPILTILVAG